MGHEFLRHIERTKVLVYVIDGSNKEPHTPTEAFENLKAELELYCQGLSTRPSLVFFNKMDLEESLINYQYFTSEYDLPVVGGSAKEGSNVEPLVKTLREMVERLKSTHDTGPSPNKSQIEAWE